MNYSEYVVCIRKQYKLNFLEILDTQIEEAMGLISGRTDTVLILKTANSHSMAALRRGFVSLLESGEKIPVVVKVSYPDQSADMTMLYSATDVGGLLVDGLGDGVGLIKRNVDCYTGHSNGINPESHRGPVGRFGWGGHGSPGSKGSGHSAQLRARTKQQ